ncbi:MAG: hypothetical protein AAGF96_18760 [Bacteroidota bacterium]
MDHIPENERKVIEAVLPKGFLWQDVGYHNLGNASQLFYKGELLGYVNLDHDPYFMSASKAK